MGVLTPVVIECTSVSRSFMSSYTYKLLLLLKANSMRQKPDGITHLSRLIRPSSTEDWLSDDFNQEKI